MAPALSLLDAGLSLLSAVPFIGSFSTAGKGAARIGKIAQKLPDVPVGARLVKPTKSAGETTLADWANNTEELAKKSPYNIPENATVKSGTKAAGYDQISYKWSDNGYNYEARWHTKTPGAPAGQGNTWVITRVTPGTSTGSARIVHILAGNNWVTRYEWQAAINAYQNGTMTAAQEAMLKAGHWLAP